MKSKKENKQMLFTQKNIEVACPEKMVWDEMDIVGEGRRLCKGCDKVLVDVTGFSTEKVHELQRKDPSICVAVSNALIVSSLSFSLLSAGGNIDEIESINDTVIEIQEVYPIEEVAVALGMPVEPPPIVIMLGVPARPTCSTGTANLNAIKRFFGFEGDRSCVERDDED